MADRGDAVVPLFKPEKGQQGFDLESAVLPCKPDDVIGRKIGGGGLGSKQLGTTVGKHFAKPVGMRGPALMAALQSPRTRSALRAFCVSASNIDLFGVQP
jgi:hypothetical protein